MHLLESYAVSAGAQIGKCYIKEQAIDLPQNKYITFHGINPKGSSRQYNHWQTVINNLQNNELFDYDIVQIGGLLDTRYDGIIHSYLGQTSYASLAFLLKNASLHLGFDSLPVHIASHYDIKIVAIYSHYGAISGPYFSSPHNIKILEPSFLSFKPTYTHNDPNNLIQSIDPTVVSNSVISLLGKNK